MSAKDVILKPIKSSEANEFIRQHHYSKKVVQNSQIHIGVYLHGSLEGVMQYGPSMDKHKIRGIVSGTPWNGFIELNRMAFTEKLPRNSESRSLAVAARIIKKHAPQIKWVITFADATQCGDGTIYRAAGFILCGIRVNKNLARLPNGETIHKLSIESSPETPRPEAGGLTYYQVTGRRYEFKKYVNYVGGTILNGHQIRYIQFIDPSWRNRLTKTDMDYSAIDEVNARMYRGQKKSGPGSENATRPPNQGVDGGSSPTPGLHTQAGA